MDDIRVFFTKKGRAKYISHLDLSRCFQRALSRSALPVWYTQGFNPHMYLTFALPLSLGAESDCDSFDCRFMEPVSLTEAKQRLQANLPEGLTVLKIEPPSFKPAEITWADYVLRLFFSKKSEQDNVAAFNSFWAASEIQVSKASKRGEKLVNLKEHCTLQEVSEIDGVLILKIRIAAGSTLNMNPTLLIGAFCKFSEEEPLKVKILRKKLYDADFLPLT